MSNRLQSNILIYDSLSLVEEEKKSVLIIRFISTKSQANNKHYVIKIFSSRLFANLYWEKEICRHICDGKSKIASIINISQYFYIYWVKSFFNIPLKFFLLQCLEHTLYVHICFSENQFLHQFYLSPENTHKTITNSAMLFGDDVVILWFITIYMKISVSKQPLTNCFWNIEKKWQQK